jgi:hypothetical protein
MRFYLLPFYLPICSYVIYYVIQAAVLRLLNSHYYAYATFQFTLCEVLCTYGVVQSTPWYARLATLSMAISHRRVVNNLRHILAPFKSQTQLSSEHSSKTTTDQFKVLNPAFRLP